LATPMLAVLIIPQRILVIVYLFGNKLVDILIITVV
jgi:hypothetical protein